MRANKVPRHAVARAMTSRFRMAQAPTYADSLKRKKRIDALAQSYYHGGILMVAKARCPMDEERCWQAVLAREIDFDGVFVYGVRSTGIFCRPTCPSRRPRRAQVVFFGQPSAAERAGFRACRR